jgi:two-component system nitrate/nitrite response regulator NarL
MNALISSKAQTIRILVAAEQPAFRNALRKVLEQEADIEVVGEAPDVPSALDILLVDFTLCQSSEASNSHGVRLSQASFRTMMMVGSTERAPVLEAFRLGARGVVQKESVPRLWYESIRKVVSGEYWLGSESTAILIRALRELLPENSGIASPRRFGLTRRELEIVDLIALGRSNKQIGLEFSICERTVKHHLTNIFSKLGVSSRLSLALYARDNRIQVRLAKKE